MKMKRKLDENRFLSLLLLSFDDTVKLYHPYHSGITAKQIVKEIISTYSEWIRDHSCGNVEHFRNGKFHGKNV